MLKHKGYTGHVELDGEAGIFRGEVLGIQDVVSFQGRSVDELQKAFQESVDGYMESCAERGSQPEKLFSGRFTVRLSPILHRDIYLAARKKGKSLNSWVSDYLKKAVKENAALPKVVKQVNTELLSGTAKGTNNQTSPDDSHIDAIRVFYEALKLDVPNPPQESDIRMASYALQKLSFEEMRDFAMYVKSRDREVWSFSDAVHRHLDDRFVKNLKYKGRPK